MVPYRLLIQWFNSPFNLNSNQQMASSISEKSSDDLKTKIPHKSKEGIAVAVIGASGGIGSALCRELAASGYHVALGGRDRDKLNDLAETVNGIALEVDATDWAQTQQFLQSVKEKYGQLYGVALCVGSILLKSAHLTSREEYERTIQLNLTTAFGVMHAAGNLLRREGGSVVFVSSVAARSGLPNHDAIAAAKAGIIGLVQSSAATYASRGIRVNAVAPALTRTPMTAPFFNNEANLKVASELNPLKRLGEPEDVARAMAWLLDPYQSWVTGQVISVDGGMSTIQSRIKS